MMKIGETVLYTQHWAGLLVALSAPLLWLLARTIARRLWPQCLGAESWIRQGGIVLLLALPLLIAGYWDVWLIGRQAQVLCEQTGLKVHRTAQAEGFLGAVSLKEIWAPYGFRYIEFGSFGASDRYTMDGSKVVREKVDQFISRYELTAFEDFPGRTADYVTKRFLRYGHRVIDRETGDVMGELISLNVYPGWVDSGVLGLLGFSWSPWVCSRDHKGRLAVGIGYSEVTQIDLVKAVLKPF